MQRESFRREPDSACSLQNSAPPVPNEHKNEHKNIVKTVLEHYEKIVLHHGKIIEIFIKPSILLINSRNSRNSLNWCYCRMEQGGNG